MDPSSIKSQNSVSAGKQTLLDLFGRRRVSAKQSIATVSNDMRALWAADALHRTKNLAQMSLSLGSDGLRHLYGRHADGRAMQARALYRAYDELGSTEITSCDVPCGYLLNEIATRLVLLFGDNRSIHLNLSLDHVMLPAERRRALILIGSELVINALKYAFLERSAGTISVQLIQASDIITLIVADDGAGMLPEKLPGSGSVLTSRLAALLHADIDRLKNSGRGLEVRVTMPRSVSSITTSGSVTLKPVRS